MTIPVLKLPDPKVAMTLSELNDVQAIAARHLSFSLTLACPLKCAHCFVNASAAQRSATLAVEAAVGYAEQMTSLYDHGIRSIGFTGGEPMMAARQLSILSEAAHHADIRTGVVTSAHWAGTPKSARETVRQYRCIQDWNISVDVYHQKFVRRQWIRNAYEAILEHNRDVTIRFSYINDPPQDEELRLLEFITTLEEASFSSQKVRSVGRGARLGIGYSHCYNPWRKPCLTTGLVVRYDGSIAPCCLNLVESRNHPFQLGKADARPLKDIHSAYMSIPLLQLIRVIGFSEVMRWIHEGGYGQRLPDPIPDEVCEICAIIMADKQMADLLVEKTSSALTQFKIAILCHRILNEDFMLQNVINRFPGLSYEIDDIKKWIDHENA